LTGRTRHTQRANPKFQLQSKCTNKELIHAMQTRHRAAVIALTAFATFNSVPPAHAQAPSQSPAEIVASVNNEPITLADYQKAEQQLRDEVTSDCKACPPEKIEAQFKDQQKDLLRGLIDQALMVQRAKDMGIKVESELNKKLDEVRQQNGLATIDDLQKGVEANGLSWEGYKATLRNGMLQKEVVKREVGSHLDVTTDEVKQYYQQHLNDFALPERVMLSEISLSTEGKTDAELAAVKSKVEGLRSSVLNGDDFVQVAMRYSQGSTAKDGGSLGTFKQGELPPQIEAAVFKLGPGQLTDVIQTRSSFEFLKVDDHLPAEVQPVEKVDIQIRNSISAVKLAPRIRQYLAELREQSNITVKPGYTDTALLTASAGAN
jgi:peptidyl-prolyl cis-trans isomerase SurA